MDLIQMCTGCGRAVFVCGGWEMYQAGERGKVHADGDHAAGEAQLAEPRLSLGKKHSEVKPTASQDYPSYKNLGRHQPLKQT